MSLFFSRLQSTIAMKLKIILKRSTISLKRRTLLLTIKTLEKWPFKRSIYFQHEEQQIYFHSTHKQYLLNYQINLPFNPQTVLTKLSNQPSTPTHGTQTQLVFNESSVDLLIGASDSYIVKTIQIIKDTLRESSAEKAIKTIEFLNANNVILNK
jgi:hypothetical protein